MLPIVVKLVNLSFASCTLRDTFKIPTVIPMLKKLLLDQENKTNYRPVSNLVFSGKLTKNVAVPELLFKQYTTRVQINNLDVLLQSAYKGHPSVETALVKVCDNVLCAVDSKSGHGSSCHDSIY